VTDEKVDARYKMLEQAAAEAAKEGRGHALAELTRRAKATREQKWVVSDDRTQADEAAGTENG
jgi:hypothetical protein